MGWWQKFRKKLVIRKKLYKRKKKYPLPKLKTNKTVTTLYKKQKIHSKLNVKDIELIDGLEVNDIKKRYGVKGSQCKVLEAMVTDYKHGRLSLPGLSHKSKFEAKDLDKDRLEKILADYKTAKNKKNVEDIEILKKNIEQLKKKLHITSSRKKVLEKMLDDLKDANRSDIEAVKAQLNPKIIDRDKFDKLLTQYETGRKKNRGISFLITKSKLSLLASKRKFSALLEEIKGLHLSEVLSQKY